MASTHPAHVLAVECVEALPAWLQPAAWLSPGTYTLRAVRAALVDGMPTSALWRDMLTLLGMGLVLVPLGLAVFSAGERYALRHGKLKRTG